MREDAPPGKRNPGPDHEGKAGPCTPGPPSEHPIKQIEGKEGVIALEIKIAIFSICLIKRRSDFLEYFLNSPHD